MKLYMHPVSTTSRPVIQFITDNKLPVEMQVVDLFTGEHMKEPFTRINPNMMIPVLEDGDFRLTESSAILKYLAETAGLPSYPKDPKRRAPVNEVMDWFNSNFYRDWGYGLIYPQLFPHLKREDPKVQEAVVAWGKDKSKAWLQVRRVPAPSFASETVSVNRGPEEWRITIRSPGTRASNTHSFG